jgi:hypothetical protein
MDYIGDGGHTTYAVNFTAAPVAVSVARDNVNGLYCYKN